MRLFEKKKKKKRKKNLKTVKVLMPDMTAVLEKNKIERSGRVNFFLF